MLQLTDLLEPISDASPTGEDMSFSGEVDAINKARQFDDPTLDQGEWVTDIKEADWEFVYSQCAALLTGKTKDLRIAGWLVEAAAKTRQFDGLAAGFELLAGLCQRYWDVIHPQIDDGDIEQRVGNLTWLLTRSVQLVKDIPLSEGRGSAYSWADFEAARVRANNAVRTGEASSSGDAGQPDIAVMEAARRKSSKGFYETLIAGCTRSQGALVELERSLDERLGAEGPSFTALKEVLNDVMATLQRYGADVGLKTAGLAAAQDGGAKLSAGIEANAPNLSGGPIKTRDQAIEQLRRVAEFFRRTEPHSPVAYLADKAANWGDLPLHTWLKSVVKDPASLAFIEEMLGVKTESRPDNT
jgi:type VI secretion system protein ImpA